MGFEFAPEVLKANEKVRKFGAGGSAGEFEVVDGLLQAKLLGCGDLIEALFQNGLDFRHRQTSDHSGKSGFDGVDEPRFDSGVALIPSFGVVAVAGGTREGAVDEAHFVTGKEDGLDLIAPVRPVGFTGEFDGDNTHGLKIGRRKAVGIASSDGGGGGGGGFGGHGG